MSTDWPRVLAIIVTPLHDIRPSLHFSAPLAASHPFLQDYAMLVLNNIYSLQQQMKDQDHLMPNALQHDQNCYNANVRYLMLCPILCCIIDCLLQE